jgi:hypothetical protein
MSFFFIFTKLENRRVEQALCGLVVPVGGGRRGKGCGRVEIVQILCAGVYKQKNDTF